MANITIDTLEPAALDAAIEALRLKALRNPVTVSKHIRLGNMAQLEVDLTTLGMPKHVLYITTHKRSNRKVTTAARVDILENGFTTHRMFQDFNETVNISPAKVASAGAVRATHEEALTGLQFILVKVVQHYKAKQDA